MSMVGVALCGILWYHVDDTKGVAKGNEPESLLAVMSGTHFNGSHFDLTATTRYAAYKDSNLSSIRQEFAPADADAQADRCCSCKGPATLPVDWAGNCAGKSLPCCGWALS